MVFLNVAFIACVFSLMLVVAVESRIPGVYSGGAWQSAHATFYGGSDASGTMGTSPFPSITFFTFNHHFQGFSCSSYLLNV